MATGIGSALLPSSARANDNLDAVAGQMMRSARIPGLAVGIARDGEAAVVRAYGFADLERRQPVTAETMFHIASITKTVTASAVMLLVEERRIALDEPIAPHLDFAILGEGAEAISFRHLLTHTSGISDEVYYEVDFRRRGADADMAIGELLRAYLGPGGRYVGAGNLKRQPGAQWDYSNIGYGLLGYLVGRIAGQDMRDLTRERLFQPLGLGHISWTIADTPVELRARPYDLVDGALRPVEPVGFPDWSAGMLRASINDLTLLVAVAPNDGVARDTRLLEASSVRQMLAMQHPAGLPDWLTAQGLGWQQSLLDGVPCINHWGGDPGVFSMAYLDPPRRTGVAVLSNLSATLESRGALKSIVACALQTTRC